MKTRTDIHRPSVINPTEYEFVAFEYVKVNDLGDALFLQEQRERIQEHMARTGGTYSRHEHGGNCMVCGSVNAVYTVLFYHQPTNTYVRMGNDCAQKCDVAFSNGDFDAFKQKIENARQAHAGKRKAEALLADKGYQAAWDLYQTWANPGLHVAPRFEQQERILYDMISKLVRYGSLSEKQFEFIGKLLVQIRDREIIQAQRKAEADAAAPCPSGRIVIEGMVLSVKVQETDFGLVTKMLVRHDTGYKVWGTRPSKTNADRGDRVRFTATVTPSNDDPKFGFYSRPSSASVVSRANPEDLQKVS